MYRNAIRIVITTTDRRLRLRLVHRPSGAVKEGLRQGDAGLITRADPERRRTDRYSYASYYPALNRGANADCGNP